MAKEMLQILNMEKRTHFMHVITGDESWFLYEYTQSSQWILSKDELLNRVEKTNMQKKMLVTIFFNGDGCVIVNFLPKGMIFNGDYFINIIQDISPSYFGLLGTVKDKLIGCEHSTEEELKEHILQILRSFPHDFWQSLFPKCP